MCDETKLKEIESKLIDMVYDNINNFDSINTTELGEIIDMIKDVQATFYYCGKINKMKKKELEESGEHTVPVNNSDVIVAR